MSGHSKWKTVKHKKESADQKRGQLFSKLLNAVALAARGEANPDFNPRLRTAILKARESNVPQENIERAIKRSAGDKDLEELTIEAYGPAGIAILITAIADNKNRTIAEIKKILIEHNAKWAEPGSVRWAFQQTQTDADETHLPAEASAQAGTNAGSQRESASMRWQAKFKQEISKTTKEALARLTQELENHRDVRAVYTNAN